MTWGGRGDEGCDGSIVCSAGCYPGQGELFAGQVGHPAGAQNQLAVDELQAAESAGVCAQAPGARMQGQMSGCRIHE